MSQIEAQRDAANLQAKMAADHEKMVRKREEEEKEQRQFERAAFINSYPTQVEQIVASITTNDALLQSLARLAEVFKTINESEWLWLSKRTPFEAPVTYSRLRTILGSRLAEWWSLRNSLTPSPVPMLKVIAQSIRFKDFQGIIAHSELPKEQSKLEKHLLADQTERKQLTDQIAQQEKTVEERVKQVQTADAHALEAKQELEKPIDAAAVATETEQELKGVGCSVSLIGVGVVFLILAFAATKQESKAATGGLMLAVPFLAFGGYMAYNAYRVRQLSEEEFKIRLDEKTQENIQKLQQSRKMAAGNAESSLKKARKEHQTAEQELQSLQGRIGPLDAQIAETSQRIKTLANDMLRDHLDPALQPIIDG